MKIVMTISKTNHVMSKKKKKKKMKMTTNTKLKGKSFLWVI